MRAASPERSLSSQLDASLPIFHPAENPGVRQAVALIERIHYTGAATWLRRRKTAEELMSLAKRDPRTCDREDVTDALADLCNDSDAAIRYAALKVLTWQALSTQEKYCDTVTECLHDEDERVRRVAAECLDAMAPSVIAPHTDRLAPRLARLCAGSGRHRSPDGMVRYTAASLLCTLLEPTELERYASAVLGCLCDTDERVRCVAVASLDRMSPDRLAEKADVLAARLMVLCAGEPQHDAAALKPHPDAEVRFASLSLLARLATACTSLLLERHARALVETLRDMDERVRRLAVGCLGRLSPEHFASEAWRLVAICAGEERRHHGEMCHIPPHPHAGIRAAALGFLSRLATHVLVEPSLLDAVARIAQFDPEASLRQTARAMLGRMQRPHRSGDALAPAVGDWHWDVRGVDEFPIRLVRR